MGVSTGVFTKSRGRWSELVTEACAISTYAVELSALSTVELPGLAAFLGEGARLPFRYASVHAPVKGLEDRSVLPCLASLPLWARSIVTHPDVIEDSAPYRDLGTRLVLENMDERKLTGRTANELEPFFDRLPEAGFCLDIAHAWSVDPTMQLAHDLLDRFRVRLRQVHLSSLADGHHAPLRPEDEELFTEVLDRCRDVPWILEAMPPARWTDQPQRQDAHRMAGSRRA